MAFSKFSLTEIKTKLDLQEKQASLFPSLPSVTISEWLKETLDLGLAQSLITEKAKSEFIVAPIILEAWKMCDKNFTIFSGASLKVDSKLVVECDFILSKTQTQEIEAPIFMLIEAKDDNLRNGYGQCVAQMYAAKLFNEKRGNITPCIYGCVTTGDDWQFLKLENSTVTFHTQRYYLSQLEIILGVLKTIVDCYKK